MSMELKAVLSDMDGTLVDSIPVWQELTQAFFREQGHDLPHEVHARCRRLLAGNADSIQRCRECLLEMTGLSMSVQELARRCDDMMAARMSDGMPWMPGAQNLLQAVREASVPMALVTSSPRRIAKAWLGSLPVPYFQKSVAGDEVHAGKPHPEPYLKAASLLGVDPAACVAVEDTLGGAMSATLAGCSVLLVSQTWAPLDLRGAWVASLERVDVRHLRSLVRWR